jgi:DNA-binding NtrC family response regulator
MVRSNDTRGSEATGLGKEVVARTIGLSGYVPFDAGRMRFASDHRKSVHALNLAALAPAVLESELFGHRRGSFTGAVADKAGWLKLGGTLFLDEIAEISEDIQVKLLRVIQERCFQVVGDSEDQPFTGKLIAATHRNLADLMQGGTFRLDLYMRICADRIRTPSLREMLDAAPGERRTLVRHLAEKATSPAEAEELTDEVEAWIDAKLPADYGWPGNVRELEQCVRARLVHHSCRPIEILAATRPDRADDRFARDFREGLLTAAQVMAYYTTVVRSKSGSVRETARRLELDRRIVTENIDDALLAQLIARNGLDEDS